MIMSTKAATVMNNKFRMIGFTELEQLRHTLAAAYMDLRDSEFRHAGVALPLNGVALEAAIKGLPVVAMLPTDDFDLCPLQDVASLPRTGSVDDVARALQEDLGSGDLTAALVPEGRRCRARILAREAAVICGAPWAEAALRAAEMDCDALLKGILRNLDFIPLTIKPATHTIKLHLALLDFMFTIIELLYALRFFLGAVIFDLCQASGSLCKLSSTSVSRSTGP